MQTPPKGPAEIVSLAGLSCDIHDLLLNSESAEMCSRQPCINIEFITHGISDAALGSLANCCAIVDFMVELYGLHSLI